MASITERKVIKVGNKKRQSSAITLPADWVRFHQPEKVKLICGNIILVIPPDVWENKAFQSRLKDLLKWFGIL